MGRYGYMAVPVWVSCFIIKFFEKDEKYKIFVPKIKE